MTSEKPKFAAGPGLDPASGLGVPNGAKLLAALQGGVVNPPPPPPPPAPSGVKLSDVTGVVDPILTAVVRDFSNHWLLRPAGAELTAAKVQIDNKLKALPW